jgi:hypothetical protein
LGEVRKLNNFICKAKDDADDDNGIVLEGEMDKGFFKDSVGGKLQSPDPGHCASPFILLR